MYTDKKHLAKIAGYYFWLFLLLFGCTPPPGNLVTTTPTTTPALLITNAPPTIPSWGEDLNQTDDFTSQIPLIADQNDPTRELISSRLLSGYHLWKDSNPRNPFLKDEAEKPLISSDFPLAANNAVEQCLSYLKKKNNFVRGALGRSNYYFPLMKSIFREKELPEDLVYLSLVESGVDPHAQSPAGACGPWQLMKATAQRYNLKVDSWVDERRDPEKSTRAAAKYLKDLYDMFGDWHLAVAAYNAGERKVADGVKKFDTSDFWCLREKSYLKQETRNFVPMLMAAIMIGKKPAEFGVSESVACTPEPLTTVHIPNSTNLNVIAEAAGISVRKLKEHNPELIKSCTPPRKYWIKIPASNEEVFAQNFFRVMEKKFAVSASDTVNYLKHRVKRGETLYDIAQKHKVEVKLILKANGIKNPRGIRPGRVLKIPVSSDTSSI